MTTSRLPVPRFALCLFLADPPRGPVPTCSVLATGPTKNSLLPALQATRELLALPSNTLNITVTAIGFVERHHVPADNVVLAIIPTDEAAARQRASYFAHAREYHDTCVQMGIRSAT